MTRSFGPSSPQRPILAKNQPWASSRWRRSESIGSIWGAAMLNKDLCCFPCRAEGCRETFHVKSKSSTEELERRFIERLVHERRAHSLVWKKESD